MRINALAVIVGLTTAPSGTLAQVVISDVSLDVSRIAEQTVPIVFTLAWDPSDSTPHDGAVWTFAKFRAPEGDWRDVRWAASGHGVVAAGGDGALNVVLPTGGPFVSGVFLTNHETDHRNRQWRVELVWDYSTSQIEMPEEGLPLMLQGIDMVRIPSGPFEVGDGRDADQTSTFFGVDGKPVTITSEAEITVGNAGQLSYNASDYGGDQLGPIPGAYPKGYNAFYVMRSELSDGQYAAFLATLSGRALAARDITRNPDYAGSIQVSDTVFAGEPARAANFITWADGIAWAAWAGLRPMTELEFEKIARGPNQYGVVQVLAGRWERVISVGAPEGRAFRGSHGWGFVDGLGMPYTFANSDWPGPMALGSGFRGGADGLGDFTNPGNRVFAAYDATYGSESEGFRAVRTAP